MEQTTVSNIYKILGGVTMAHFFGVVGGAIGFFVGAKYGASQSDNIDEVTEKSFYGHCAGAGAAHAASIYMGYKISKSHDMDYMGKAQMVYSSLGIGLVTLTAVMGRYLLDESNPSFAGLKVIAPAILIGKSPQSRKGLGAPKTDAERKEAHLALYGTTEFPARGSGILIGRN